MARSFLTPINLNQNELQNARLQNLAAAPGSPVNGQVYWDTVASVAFVYNGGSWINWLARANHTGTQLAATISDLASTVQAYSLSTFAVPTGNLNLNSKKIINLAQPSASGDAAEFSWVTARSLSAFAAPTGNLPMAGFKLTGLGTATVAGDATDYSFVTGRNLNTIAGAAATSGNVPMNSYKFTGLAAPTTAGDSAEYAWVISQVQAAAAGIASKYPVQAVATTNQGLTGLSAIDGYTPVAGDRILCVGQTTASANGVYNAAAGAWARTTNEGAAPGELEPGALWLVTNGTANAGTQWRCSNTGAITVGTTNVTVVQFSASTLYTAGNGLTLSGGVFTAVPKASGGIVVDGTGISVDTTIVARKFAGTIGDGSSTSIVVTHNLGTTDVHLQVRQVASPYAVVECDMQSTSTTTATFIFASAPTAGQYRVVALG